MLYKNKINKKTKQNKTERKKEKIKRKKGGKTSVWKKRIRSKMTGRVMWTSHGSEEQRFSIDTINQIRISLRLLVSRHK